MKCPVTSTTRLHESGKVEFDQADCLKEGCAWWSPGGKSCAIFSLNVRLAEIVKSLKDIASRPSLGGAR